MDLLAGQHVPEAELDADVAAAAFDLAGNQRLGTDGFPVLEIRRVAGVVGADLGGVADGAEQAGAGEIVADHLGHLRAERGSGERGDGDRDRRGAGAIDGDLRVGGLGHAAMSAEERHGGDAGAEECRAAAE